MVQIDFDEWANLYRDHPEEFERKRKELLDAEIAKAPIASRNKLRLLQMECDAYRESLPPLQAAAAMSNLMLEKVFELEDAVLDMGIACQAFDEVAKSLDK
jgi:hypothetical protein